MTNLGKLLTAMVTPMNADLSINYKVVEQLVNHLIATGSEGIVVHGTTGESPTLTHAEELELYKAVVKIAKGRAAVVAGTGSNSTATTVEMTRKAEEAGVDGSMVVVPYYNKPSQEGLYQHYKTVADATKLPIIIYNIVGRTGVNMETATVARLAQIKNIVGVKEASGNLDQVSAVRASTPSDFIIWSGDDSLTLPIMAVGGIGVISVVSHVAGRQIKEMIEAYQAGNVKKALELHLKLLPLFKVMFITTNPTPIKEACNLIGIPVGKPRLPLVAVTEKEREAIAGEMRKLGII
jgi:4-hydroxy-tetrahydrodipicolinate synthase